MESFKVFINFKTYAKGGGGQAVKLVKVIEGVVRDRDRARVEIIPIVQVVDLWRVKQETRLPVWVQSVDPHPQGKFTGWTNLEAVIEAGAEGTLISHSEHVISPGMIKQALARVRDRDRVKDTKFEAMVCGKTLGQIERLIKLKPDYMAYEIAELIGTKTSITSTNPKAIEHAVKICGNVPLIVGAGVNRAEDLVIARKLGAKGALISSAIVLDNKPGEKLATLLKGF